jgi:hypothetical protein
MGRRHRLTATRSASVAERVAPFGQKGSLDVGGKPEFRIRKMNCLAATGHRRAAMVGGAGLSAGSSTATTAFADYVWKPLVLIEMKKRGTDLARTYRQAFDYWTRLVPGRPHYVVLCNFDEFWVYDFDSQRSVKV